MLFGLIFLLMFSIYDCGGSEAISPEPEELEEIEGLLEDVQASVQPLEVEGVTEELASVVEHFIAQGINITHVESVLLSGTLGAEAGLYVSTDVTFFELYQFDLDNADEKTLNYLENLNEEYSSLNGNIMMAHPDRFDEYEEDYYTEAVEAIIDTFERF